MSEVLIFGSESQSNFQFSNESPHGFVEDGVEWPTVEHYIIAQKFPGEKYVALREKIRTAARPRKVILIVNVNARHVRPDWKEVRDDIMMHALRLKFADEELARKLMNTGSIPLAFDGEREKYWSIGQRGEGENRLGTLLEALRTELKQNA